jgi:hypothetical protein
MTKKYKLGIISAIVAFALLAIGCILHPHKPVRECCEFWGFVACIFLMILTLLPSGNDRLR